jgi:hypothetical protein
MGVASRGTRAAALAILALAFAACGCSGSSLQPQVNLQVLISSGRISERFNRQSLRQVVDSEVADFSRANPQVTVHVRYVPDEEVLAMMRKRSAMGAGPDLIIARVPQALEMSRERLSQPSGLTTRELAPLRIRHLEEFRRGDRYAAIPFLLQPNLACYNRWRMPQAPTSLADLLRQSEEGRRIGLSLVLDQLSWTGSAGGAQDALLRLFDSPPQTTAGRSLGPADRQRVLAWLGWLYRANVNPNIQFSDTNEDLAELLMKRELDWISCNSAVIPTLRKALGDDLALAVLPGESAAKPARAVARMQTLSFGRDSAPAQREAAEGFAQFLLNDYSQNMVMTSSVGILPVNANVIVPVKRSAQLAAIKASEPFAIVPSFRQAVGVRLQRLPLTRLIKQNVYGEAPPEEVLREIEALARQRGQAPASAGSAPPERPVPANLQE